MAYKGKYFPKNISKYKGDPTTIIFRSLWERRVMKYLDENSAVIAWNSEEVVIPYIGPDGKRHRYYVDFYVEYKHRDGRIEKMLLEVKPKAQTIPPKLPKNGRKTSRFYLSERTYIKNSAKWKAAEEYCEQNGWKFKILTEDDLDIRKRR